MTALPEPINVVDIQSLIDRYRSDHHEEPRGHLGVSTLGHPCDRWVWLSFRWAVIEHFPGRILRLFRRGQREEETIIKDLRAIGITINHTCLDADGQSRVDFGCHVSGSIDGIIESGVPTAEKTRHIAEFKTHSLKSFRELQKIGVKAAKPIHWWQMQGYMLGTGIERALYVAVCKDNDEMYTERVYFDKEKAEALIKRGHRLALLERMPEPLSADPSWYQCKFCAAYDFCHKTHCIREVNCRTCAHVTPTQKGAWMCALSGDEPIREDEQLLGCPRHVLHFDLVPWKWCGGTADGRCGLYEADGRRFINGEPAKGEKAFTSRALLGQEPFVAKDVFIPF